MGTDPDFHGLVAGLIGDLLLGLRPLLPQEDNNELSLPDRQFSVGHIFYYFALLSMDRFSVYPLITGIAVL